jgi:hypothetical protein
MMDYDLYQQNFQNGHHQQNGYHQHQTEDDDDEQSQGVRCQTQ